MVGKITRKIKVGTKSAEKSGSNGKNGKKDLLKDARQKLPPAKPAKLDTARFEGDRAAVERELERLHEALQDLPEVSIEEADPALIEREKNLALVQQLERRLDEMNLAKQAAKKGKYGICERCGAVIPPERLEIFPETRHCVKCKNELEQLARRGIVR
jgi:RNA polymerase-binding transcription factor DksA